MTVFEPVDTVTQLHDDHKIIFDPLFQTEFHDYVTLHLYLHTATLLFLLSFNVLETMHDRLAKIIVC